MLTIFAKLKKKQIAKNCFRPTKPERRCGRNKSGKIIITLFELKLSATFSKFLLGFMKRVEMVGTDDFQGTHCCNIWCGINCKHNVLFLADLKQRSRVSFCCSLALWCSKHLWQIYKLCLHSYCLIAVYMLIVSMKE